MPKKEIKFEIDLSDEDTKRLCDLLICSEQDLPAKLSGHGKAALIEYTECYLGNRAFSRGSDILEHRLALLISYAFDQSIPNDATVSGMLQTTLSASRTLLRNTLSKYRYILRAATTASAKAALENATWKKDRTLFSLEIKATNLVDLFNQKLLADKGPQKQVAKSQDNVGTYEISEASYTLLCNAFGATEVAKK